MVGSILWQITVCCSDFYVPIRNSRCGRFVSGDVQNLEIVHPTFELWWSVGADYGLSPRGAVAAAGAVPDGPLLGPERQRELVGRRTFQASGIVGGDDEGIGHRIAETVAVVLLPTSIVVVGFPLVVPYLSR
jgi:hypothetical protein